MLASVVRELFTRISGAVSIPVVGEITERLPIPGLVVSIGAVELGEPSTATLRITVLAQDVIELSHILDQLAAALRATDYHGAIRGTRRVQIRGASPLEATPSGALAEVEIEVMVL